MDSSDLFLCVDVFPPTAAHLCLMCCCHSERYIEVTSSPQNAFVQLSLAFRNDNYTLETRLKQAERERNLTEEDTEKELEEFKGALKVGTGKKQILDFFHWKSSLLLLHLRNVSWKRPTVNIHLVQSLEQKRQ